MNRFRLFTHNIGSLGIFQCVIAAIFFAVMAVHNIRHGSWMWSIVPFTVAFIMPYGIRTWLVAHLDTIRHVMNILAAIAIGAFVLLPKTPISQVDPWQQTLLFSLVGAYFGCYF